MININEPLQSSRLTLMPPSLELQPQVLAAIVESKEQLAEFLPWVKYALTESESIDNMKLAIQNFEQFDNELRFFIIDRADNQLIGAVGLIIKDKTVPYFEIGYWLRTGCVGQGYVTEAVNEVTRFAQQTLNARRVEIRCDETNTKSKAVAQRCGFEFEGRLKNTNTLPSGELSNTLVFAKTR